MTDIVTGDNMAIPISLKKNGADFIIDPTAVVTATLVYESHRLMTANEPILLTSSDPGADWSESNVTLVIPGSFTSGIPVSTSFSGLIELQVSEGGLQDTWFIPVEIIRGNL